MAVDNYWCYSGCWRLPSKKCWFHFFILLAAELLTWSWTLFILPF